MAAPSYTTDLTTIATGDLNVDAGTWDESTDAGWDTAGAMVDDQNLYYNNTECVSAQYTKDGTGTGAAGPGTIFYNHTASFTIPADGAALIHHLWAAPPALNTIGNATSAGINICAGSSLGDFYAWAASGSDFAPAPKGGWTNYAINPAIGGADHTVGTAPTVYSMIGVAVSALQQARGNPQACNAVRYGRCESRFTLGDIANGYATFTGFGAIDATSTNKWSLLDPIEGGYKFQGLMSLGLTGTAVDFRDSNANISIANTINVTSAFNAIEVHNAGSNVEWTAINITALGTVSKGTFEMVDNATVAKTNCVFTDMSTFIYQSNATLTNTTYRRTDQVTQDGATFDSSTFDNLIAAVSLVVSNLAVVTDCNFNSDGSNHAVNLGTITANTSVDWKNYTTDYAVANGATGNEAILVNVGAGFTLTVNVGTGYDTPYYYNTGAGTVSVVSGQDTVTVKVLHSDGTTLTTTDANVLVEAATGGALTVGTDIIKGFTDASGLISDSRTYAGDQPLKGWVRKGTAAPFYREFPITATLIKGSDLTLTIQLVDDD